MLTRVCLLFLVVAMIGCGGLTGSGSRAITFRATGAPAYYLVANPADGRLYYDVSNPSTSTGGGGGTTGGGSLSSMDPASPASPTSLVTFTESPGVVAVSDDGTTAYVALQTQIAKVDLTNPSNVTYYPMGIDGTLGQLVPVNLAVLPGHSNSVVVAYVGVNDYSHVITALFTDGVQQSNTVADSGRTGLSFVGSNQMVATRSSGGVVSLLRMSVDSSGITLQTTIPLAVSNPSDLQMVAADGRVYFRSGEVFDATSGALVKACDVPNPAMAIGVVPSKHRLYFWAGFDLLVSFDSSGAITPIPTQSLPASGGLPSSCPMVALGNDGLAFVQSDGTIGLVDHTP